jgi:hypothetical protein
VKTPPECKQVPEFVPQHFPKAVIVRDDNCIGTRERATAKAVPEDVANMCEALEQENRNVAPKARAKATRQAVEFRLAALKKRRYIQFPGQLWRVVQNYSSIAHSAESPDLLDERP